MLDVREAARKAAEYFASLYDANTYADLQLEEVELTEDEKYWLITLSYAYADPMSSAISTVLKIPSSKPRKYKQFKIDAATGKVQAMTIRKVG